MAAVVADVTEPEAPARLVAEAAATYGRLDIVVANAGGPPPARALEVDDTGIAAAINDNLACPGLHDTDRIREVGHGEQRLGNPADFGKVVASLCSQPAGFISGDSLGVDGASVVGLL